MNVCMGCETSLCLETIEHTNTADYTEYAGLEFPVNLCIAWPFSWQIVNVNAGPTTALDSMGAKHTFRCHSFNIALMYKQ